MAVQRGEALSVVEFCCFSVFFFFFFFLLWSVFKLLILMNQLYVYTITAIEHEASSEELAMPFG